MSIQEIWNGLYIGDVVSMIDPKIREINGIGALLDCTKEIIPIKREGEEYMKLGLVDCTSLDVKDIIKGVLFIHWNMMEGKKVLVSCAAGMSRSASLVLAYMVHSGWGFDEAYNYLKNKRPIINIHPKMMNSLKKYFLLSDVQ